MSDGEPFLSTEVNWYLTNAMRPEIAQGEADDFWLIEIDGRPSARLKLELYDQPDDRSRGRTNPFNRVFLATAIPAVQAICGLIAAPPGIVQNAAPQFYSKTDLRR